MIDNNGLGVLHKFGSHGFDFFEVAGMVGILNLLLLPFDEAVDERSGSVHYLSRAQ
jgi:hypothetical protein